MTAQGCSISAKGVHRGRVGHELVTPSFACRWKFDIPGWRDWVALRRPRPAGAMDLQIRQQSSRNAPDECAGTRDGGGDQAGNGRPLRSADFSVEPARFRYRHAEPGPLWWRRVLHAVRA